MAFSTGAVLLLAATVAAAGLPSSRISGGENADIEDYPFVLQLDFLSTSGNSWSQYGGGVLINNFYAITSAHKFFESSFAGVETARVRAGSSQRNSAGVIYGVNTISIHPDYADDAERDADIAVVRLARAVDFTDKIQAGILYTANSVIPDNAEVTVVGWGNTGSLGASPSRQLQALTLNHINQEVCEQRYGFGVTDNMICYGILDTEERKSPCFGDAGGPVIYNNGVIGLISWGQSCANSYFPSVGTFIPAVVDWVLAEAS
ncbi:unnamed protein product [Plutella xylostella]|uniref:(diamondback moth) hypothetical protein n=1 Tax=Plutella xylostella TaxID=51655 RepID=A0A8S4ENW7_PLUXY|nr:unnamed protein product [Plutella xylostella]